MREDIILGFPRGADVDIVEAERAYGVPHRITRRTVIGDVYGDLKNEAGAVRAGSGRINLDPI